LTGPAAAATRAQFTIQPVSLKEACAFVEAHHGHHGAPRGHKFSIGLARPGGDLVAVAIVGRPVSRHLDDGYTLEVTRLATLGVPGSCSRLYSAAWRAARAIGYRRMITYTQGAETGASLKASGWHKVRDLAPRPGWNSQARPRRDLGADNIARTLWQVRAPAVGA
jgi:hypothetical protein